jgi:hypothetical protein
MRNIIIALLFLMLGMCIYATCRQDVIFLAPFVETEWLEMIKITFLHNENLFVYFFLFHLPDMLWYMALLLLQMQFCNVATKGSNCLFTISVLLPFLLECLQYFKAIKGTFDVLDIIFYCLTLILFVLCQRKKLKRMPCLYRA